MSTELQLPEYAPVAICAQQVFLNELIFGPYHSIISVDQHDAIRMAEITYDLFGPPAAQAPSEIFARNIFRRAVWLSNDALHTAAQQPSFLLSTILAFHHSDWSKTGHQYEYLMTFVELVDSSCNTYVVIDRLYDHELVNRMRDKAIEVKDQVSIVKSGRNPHKAFAPGRMKNGKLTSVKLLSNQFKFLYENGGHATLMRQFCMGDQLFLDKLYELERPRGSLDTKINKAPPRPEVLAEPVDPYAHLAGGANFQPKW